jgi:hypothetical protein
LALARQTETQAQWLARDIRTLAQWLSRDVLALAGPDLATRQGLFDFIANELERLESKDARRIRPVRVALRNQRDDLLAFAGVLDKKLAGIARSLEMSHSLVREACVLHRPAHHLHGVLAGVEPTPGGDGRPSTRGRGQVPRRLRRGEPSHSADPTQQFAGGEPRLAAAQLFHAASPFGQRVSGSAAILP